MARKEYIPPTRKPVSQELVEVGTNEVEETEKDKRKQGGGLFFFFFFFFEYFCFKLLFINPLFRAN